MKTLFKRYTKEEKEFLASNYDKLSHNDIGDAIGRTVNSVRNKCHEMGLVDKNNLWNDEQISLLKCAYENKEFSEDINLDDLSEKIGKLKSNVCRKAKELGLTSQSRKVKKVRKIRINKFSTKEELSAHMSLRIKKWIAENGHPRGALGMKHTDEAKRKMAEATKRFNENCTDDMRSAISLKTAKTKEKNGTQQNMNRANASWGAGWRDIGDIRKYYRSKWEANYARYLEWLKSIGEIQSWLHEPETFWFDGIKRGCLSYLPDFRVVEKNGSIAYHEVKGWMDDRSKTKIKRMAKYHPQIKLIVIESKAYAAIKKTMKPMILDWEVDSKGR